MPYASEAIMSISDVLLTDAIDDLHDEQDCGTSP
jgi:hypothetical protein